MRGLAFDIRVYRDTIRDIIAAPADTSIPDIALNGAYTLRNDGFAEVSGADLQLQYRSSPRTRFILGYGHANQEGRTLTVVSPVTHGSTLHSTPTETTNLMVIHRFPNGF